MVVGRRDVEHVARLARLQLDAGEIERLTVELNDILGHVEELEAAEPAGERNDPDAPSFEAEPAVLRDDDGTPDLLQIPPASFAPSWEDGFFTLPRLDALGGDDEP